MTPRQKKVLILTGMAISVVATLVVLYVVKKTKKMKRVFVDGEFKANNCDELHAFEGTNGKTIGGMNTKVNAELDRLYKQGYNPKVTKVEVDMDAKEMKVKWKVTIEESKDGKAWIGLTSRGSSGANAFERAVGKNVGQDPETIKGKLKSKYEEPMLDFVKVDELFYNMDSKTGKSLGSCPTRQVFYAYTKPNKYPPNK